MPIATSEVERVKAAHDLVQVVEAHGVKLTKKGQSFVGLCPFHEESTPSFTVNPAQQLYHCFGCPPEKGKTGGDVISFVSRKRGLSFREALTHLGADLTAAPVPATLVPAAKSNGTAVGATARTSSSTSSPPAALKVVAPSSAPPPPTERTPEQRKLLERVVRFYQAAFPEDPRGREYLKRRGIADAEALEVFGAGFVTGKLVEALPSDQDLVPALQALGILNEKKRETFFGCVVFPLLDPLSGAPVGLYGRRIDDGPLAGGSPSGTVTHLYLAGPRRGLLNWQAAKRSPTVILTESVIDALSLYANGFRNTIPLYGTQGFTADHETLLDQHGVREVYLVLDADEPGQRAADLLAAKLIAKGLEAYRVELPEKDANAFFLRHTPEELEQLLKQANPKSLTRSAHVAKRGEEAFTVTEHGFAVRFGGRSYEAKGIARTDTQLKVTLKAVRSDLRSSVGDVEAPGGAGRRPPFELTTLDLYSARSREIHAKTLARLFGENEALVREDLMRLVEKAETFTAEAQARRAEATKPTMTEAEKEEALAFLTDPALERRIVEDLDAIGLCGEETNKLLGYLVATSRLLDEPLSMVIQSRSGAGKSALQDAVLSLMPPEVVCKYTRITDQALFYREGDSLKHKVLALEEAEGMGGAVYSIRALQSAGEVRILSTGKDPQTGQMVSRETVVEGPVSFLMTTTRPSTEVDGELSSRNLFTTVDESRARTEEILRAQRSRWTLEGLQHATARSAIQARHWNAQRLLEPLAVVNRYADQLRFPPDSLRARRDQPKYLAIVAALALLGQKQRPIREITVKGKTVRYVEVTPTDVAVANQLATEALGHSLDELSPPSRKLLDEVRTMVRTRAAELGVAAADYAFARRDVREWTGWSDFQIKVHIRELEELEYLWARQGKRGREYVYELRYGGEGKDGRRFLLGLTPAEELVDPVSRPPTTDATGHADRPRLEGAKRHK